MYIMLEDMRPPKYIVVKLPSMEAGDWEFTPEAALQAWQVRRRDHNYPAIAYSHLPIPEIILKINRPIYSISESPEKLLTPVEGRKTYPEFFV